MYCRPHNEFATWVYNYFLCNLFDRVFSAFREFFYISAPYVYSLHDDVIKWEHFPRYWPFVRGIHRSTVNPPHKGQWRGALVFSLICAWINGSVKNRETGDLRRHRAPIWRHRSDIRFRFLYIASSCLLFSFDNEVIFLIDQLSFLNYHFLISI